MEPMHATCKRLKANSEPREDDGEVFDEVDVHEMVMDDESDDDRMTKMRCCNWHSLWL